MSQKTLTNANDKSYYVLSVCKELNELCSDADNSIATWRKYKNKKCYKCKKYGHIASMCEKVCHKCLNVHNKFVCPFELNKTLALINKDKDKFAEIKMAIEKQKSIYLERLNFKGMSVETSCSFTLAKTDIVKTQHDAVKCERCIQVWLPPTKTDSKYIYASEKEYLDEWQKNMKSNAKKELPDDIWLELNRNWNKFKEEGKLFPVLQISMNEPINYVDNYIEKRDVKEHIFTAFKEYSYMNRKQRKIKYIAKNNEDKGTNYENLMKKLIEIEEADKDINELYQLAREKRNQFLDITSNKIDKIQGKVDKAINIAQKLVDAAYSLKSTWGYGKVRDTYSGAIRLIKHEEQTTDEEKIFTLYQTVKKMMDNIRDETKKIMHSDMCLQENMIHQQKRQERLQKESHNKKAVPTDRCSKKKHPSYNGSGQKRTGHKRRKE